MKIGIIGAGFTGLSAGYYLQKKGHDITIFEKDQRPGGLALGYQEKEWQWSLEKHYHHWFTNDDAILRLAKELHFDVLIKKPKTSIFLDGNSYQLDSPKAILAFPKLTMLEKVRMSIVLAFLRFNPFWKPLEKIHAIPFLTKTMGKKAFSTLWEPQLRNKMGKYADEISLVWFWTRIYKRTSSLAYPKGGFLAFAQNLVKNIVNQHGKIHFETEILSLEEKDRPVVTFKKDGKEFTEIFDRVIVTLPSYQFLAITKSLPDVYRNSLKKLKGLGATNMVIRLKKPFMEDSTYWLSVCEKNAPVMVVVEHTNLIAKKNYNNEHIIYVGNYPEPSDSTFTSTKENLLKLYDPLLKRINSDYKKNIIDYEIFKAPFAQPIIPVNYSRHIPSFSTPLPHVYLANIEQVYPWDRGTNYAVELGKKIADIVDNNEELTDQKLEKYHMQKLLLLAIFLFAAFLRFSHLNWDQGSLFHPDERNIDNAVSQIQLFSQMDPKFYAYGGFIIYLYKITADILAIALNLPTIPHDWGWINVIGRSFSAFFSLCTLFPILLIGKKLFNKNTALIACAIYAATVGSIQAAHYATTESILTFEIAWIIYLCMKIYESFSYKKLLLLAMLLGISIATKTTGASFFIVPACMFALFIFQRKNSIYAVIKKAAILGLLALFTYVIFSPFTFLNWDKFMESMHYENAVVLGTLPVVYTLQFSHTIPYLFQLSNLFWQIGPFMLIILPGIVAALIKTKGNKWGQFLVFSAFPCLYFLYVGSWYAKFVRYMTPLLPLLILFGAYLLTIIYKRYQKLGALLIAFCIIATYSYALSFSSIYSTKQTRVKASEWIYQHIPKKSVILTEHWDEGLPIPLPTSSPSEYLMKQLTIYDQDNAEKIHYYAKELSTADYITINSRRLYGTLMHLPEKYPITKRYYEMLFAEKLGYIKVAEFSSYPRLFGIMINDDRSEETFQVYDHPKAMVFKNEKHFTKEAIANLLIIK